MRHHMASIRLLSFALAAVVCGAGAGPAWARQKDVPAADQAAAAADQVHVMRTHQLVGQSVQGAQNETLGEISDLMVDPAAGKVRYMVISSDGSQYAVPWQAVDFAHPLQQFKLDITADRLKQAPQGADIADRQQAERIFKFYGIAPYWEKEQGGRQ